MYVHACACAKCRLVSEYASVYTHACVCVCACVKCRLVSEWANVYARSCAHVCVSVHVFTMFTRNPIQRKSKNVWSRMSFRKKRSDMAKVN